MLIAAIVCGATAFAGEGPIEVITPLPDAGASVLLLSLGVAALGLVRRNTRR